MAELDGLDGALDTAALDDVAGTVLPALNAGFLWVFWSSETFFKLFVMSIPTLSSCFSRAWISAADSPFF